MNYDGSLLHQLYDEMLRIEINIQRLNNEFKSLKPSKVLMTEISTGLFDCPIYKNNINRLEFIDKDTRNKFIVCYQDINILIKTIERHNELYKMFLTTYINDKIPLESIKDFDPIKQSSCQNVCIQYQMLVQAKEPILKMFAICNYQITSILSVIK